MLLILNIRVLTKYAVAMSFLLAGAISQGNDLPTVDFKYATPEGTETVRVETRLADPGDQNLNPQGIVYVTADALKKVNVEKSELTPLKKNNETIGFFTKAGLIKHFTTYEKVYVTTLSVILTGASIVVGQVIAGSEISLKNMLAVPLTMALSLAYRFYYNDFVTFFNYSSFTPAQFQKSRQLAKEYLETGVKPAGLKNASGFEQLVKMYMLEVTFMGLASVGSSGDAGAMVTFILTSIAYTLTTTYDLIIAKKRDAMIAKNPKDAQKIKLTANIASMGAAFIDNVTMMAAKSGSIWGSIMLWSGALALNVYHFGAEKLWGGKFQCATLF